MDKLLIFDVIKPQGIKGDMKIKYYTDSFDSIAKIKVIFDSEGKEYKVRKIRDDSNGFAIIYLDLIQDRNAAELLRGKSFFAFKKDIKKDESAFFIQDLIGLDVFFKQEYLGKITDVLKMNVDMFEFEGNGRKGYFPFLKKLEIEIVPGEKLTVNSDEFEGVVYYED